MNARDRAVRNSFFALCELAIAPLVGTSNSTSVVGASSSPPFVGPGNTWLLPWPGRKGHRNYVVKLANPGN